MEKEFFNSSLFAFIWSFTITIFAIPSIINLAHNKRLFDEPNERTVHVKLTPRLGGLAIFAGFMSALTVFGEFKNTNYSIQQVFAGCILLFFIGLKDDIAPVSAFKKFFTQVVAASIVVFVGDIRITSFYGFLDIHGLTIQESYGITFIIIIGITNAINLIDGLDGLAGILIVLILGVFTYYFYIYNSPYVVFGICLIGAILGFLKYNIYKATIFMGDIGSLVCGFSVAVLAIEFIEMQEVQNAVPIGLAALIIPISDTLKVFSIRIFQGKSPFSPDKTHIHHRLMDLGLPSIAIVALLATGNIIFVMTVIYFQSYDINLLILGILVTSIILIGALELLLYFKIGKNEKIEK